MTEVWRTDRLRQLPAVTAVLREPLLQGLDGEANGPLVAAVVAEAVEALRGSIQAAISQAELARLDLSPQAVATDALHRLQRLRDLSLRPVINATGIVLHTNLGRAVLAAAATEAVGRAAAAYTNLEYDLDAGERGSRQAHVADLLCRLTGAEGALVVNNNAGAVLLALRALAAGREVLVSRGELVEIGGSFRVPDVMRESGARLVEVGTTNRTHLSDYARAITPDTALLLKVHTSNYRLVGFTASVSEGDLARLGKDRGLPLLSDLGSGTLLDLALLQIPSPDPTPQAQLRAGCDVVTFSGDKLLGGPQAGIILGRRPLVEAMRAHPLHRAFRLDKLSLAALEATLRLYLDPAKAVREVPVLRMLAARPEDIRERARRFAAGLSGARLQWEIVPGVSESGGGTLPGQELPTYLLACRAEGLTAGELAARLRMGSPPVVGRIAADKVLLDLRTVLTAEEAALTGALYAATEGRDRP
ncbi:MAG: L-seryl-tRNA(Sec) selenium transferase [Bacillota bacterium]